MPAINEGKACDAVIRRIEAREGCPRSDFSLPEKELHQAPVEAARRIGNRLFAFEHTRIEPFETHARPNFTTGAAITRKRPRVFLQPTERTKDADRAQRR